MVSRLNWRTRAAAPGTRGVDAALIGHVVLTFLSGVAAVALVNVCMSFFERHSSLEMSLEREDGRKLTLKMQNVKPDQLSRTLKTVREFFGAA